MLQDEAIVLLLVELLGTDGQDMTQGQKPFFLGAPFISGKIPANISTPVSLSSSLMMEGSQPPLRQACFHVITKADEISLEDLTSLFGRFKLYLSSPRNKAKLGNLACVMPTDHPFRRHYPGWALQPEKSPRAHSNWRIPQLLHHRIVRRQAQASKDHSSPQVCHSCPASLILCREELWLQGCELEIPTPATCVHPG